MEIIVESKYFALSFLVFLATRRPLCRVSCVGARPGRPEEARGHHSLISPRSVSGLGTSEPGQGRSREP